MARLGEAQIGCRPYFTPIHLQPFYREMFGYKEGATSLSLKSWGGRA